MKRIYEKSEDMIRFERIYKIDKSLDKIENEIIKRNTPLIQVYDSKHSLVTFLYFGDDSSNSVLVLPPLGMGNFDENQMEKFFNTNMWHASYLVRNDVRFGYYFSPNDPLDQDWEKRYKRLIRDKHNPRYTAFKGQSGKKDLLRSDFIQKHSENHIWTSTLKEVSKGQISKHVIKSDLLNEERTFSIYLPVGYENQKSKLSFLLSSDGEEHLDLLSADVVLDNLIYQNKIPMTIGIFVDSSKNRSNELKCNETYIKFIVDELLPWLREHYNISDKPEMATITGVSLGGLTSVYVGLQYPEVFGNVLCQSGSFWYHPKGNDEVQNGCWMSQIAANTSNVNSIIYMNVGLLETPDRMIETNVNFNEVLNKLNYDVEFEQFKSGHDYMSWGEYLGRGMISLYQRNQLKSLNYRSPNTTSEQRSTAGD